MSTRPFCGQPTDRHKGCFKRCCFHMHSCRSWTFHYSWWLGKLRFEWRKIMKNNFLLESRNGGSIATKVDYGTWLLRIGYILIIIESSTPNFSVFTEIRRQFNNVELFLPLWLKERLYTCFNHIFKRSTTVNIFVAKMLCDACMAIIFVSKVQPFGTNDCTNGNFLITISSIWFMSFLTKCWFFRKPSKDLRL